ncbi:hypothetical protein J6590_012655 [Homalodisca vitripennis]|nr:hypothetical protein J6590_012655 [Homalodisca vitripennis]
MKLLYYANVFVMSNHHFPDESLILQRNVPDILTPGKSACWSKTCPHHNHDERCHCTSDNLCRRLCILRSLNLDNFTEMKVEVWYYGLLIAQQYPHPRGIELQSIRATM